jgi:5-methylcytosine-specific restriction endonuclease McrA
MSRVLVVDAARRPLMPTTPARARILLKTGRAAVLRRFPFILILKEAKAEAAVQPLRLKLDPGAQTTGLAVVNDASGEVVWAAEMSHRGDQVHTALLKRARVRRGRRLRHTQYRQPRFANRRRTKGWLAPALLSRVQNVLTWVSRLSRFCPIGAISYELVCFDMALLQNPNIAGSEYQRGTLWGVEVRQYLLTMWEHRCAYCGATGVSLEIDHVIPQSHGGSNRVTNLVIACRVCNLAKGDKLLEDFLADRPEVHAHIQAQFKAPLKDAALINSTRWALHERLKALGLPLETSSGGLTKWNRQIRGLPKRHWIDAACCGRSTPPKLLLHTVRPWLIEAKGRQSRQMVNVDHLGFPRSKPKGTSRVRGFRTGDLAKAVVPSHLGAKGVHSGRVLVRTRGIFDLQTRHGRVRGIPARYCHSIHQNDGCAYQLGSALPGGFQTRSNKLVTLEKE